MAKIMTRITELEAILTDCKECYEPEEIASMNVELAHLNYIQELWNEFGDIPMNPKTECIECEWNGFPSGTFRDDIWHWFESEFNLCIANDLLY